jgi:NAD(P)-dependent dehydrogenase (short-subunit alcohol dehydrogenase family)
MGVPFPGSIRSHFDLDGRNALVTGASTGMGRAIAIALAEFGANVAIQYNADADRAVSEAAAASGVVATVQAFGRRGLAIDADLSRLDAVPEVWSAAVGFLGKIDIVVVNAAIHARARWDQIDPEQFERELTFNLKGTFALLALAVPPMVERNWGRVLGIGSTTQMSPRPDLSLYCALKSAQENFMRNLAKMHARSGVTFNTLSPGLVITPRNLSRRANQEEWKRAVDSENPMGRAGQPEEVAGLAVLLCSKASSFMTGTNIWVDGGAHMPMQI